MIACRFLASTLALLCFFADAAAHTCTPIFFVGGAKCGSTTLAILLKHKPGTGHTDENGPFDRAGKEVCWRPDMGKRADGAASFAASFTARFKTKCAPPHTFGLDACPHMRSEVAMKAMSAIPGSVAIFLVREPVARLQSHFNEVGLSRQTDPSKVDSWCWANRMMALQRYARNYETLLTHFPQERVVVIESEDLKHQHRLDAAMANLQTKSGLPKRTYTVLHANVNQGNGTRHFRGTLSPGMAARLAEFYREWNNRFFKLIGRDLGWSQPLTA